MKLLKIAVKVSFNLKIANFSYSKDIFEDYQISEGSESLLTKYNQQKVESSSQNSGAFNDSSIALTDGKSPCK